MICDYENEVLRFYDWLETNELGTSCIVLWHALMQTYRKAECPELFTVAISVLEIKTGLKRTTIKRARNELKQCGRIDWFERKGNQSAQYKIILFENAVVKRPQSDPQHAPQSDPQHAPQSDPIIYNNNNDIIVPDDDVVVNKNAVVKRPQTAPQCGPQTAPQNSKALQSSFDKHGDALKNVQRYYEQHIGNLLSTTAYMKVIDFFEAGVDEALVCKALDRSIDAGARNWVYAESILDSCVVKGILTLEQYELSEANRKASKTRMGKNGSVNANGNDSANSQSKTPEADPYRNIGSIEL